MNEELDEEYIFKKAGEFMDQNLQEELDIQPEAAVVEEEEQDDSVMVDGQDLRNHPQFEELNLSTPWQEDEGKFGYIEKYPEIYTGATPTENAQIFMKRKHALKGDVPMEIRNSIYKGGIDLVSSVLTAPERFVDMTPVSYTHLTLPTIYSV